MAEDLERPLIMLPGPTAKEFGEADGPERRSSPRYPFSAVAEVSELDSRARIMGRCSDLGLEGCYIDSIAPFPVGSVVRVRLEREPRRFEALARITYAHDLMGMGIAFTQIKPEHLNVLKNWLAELSGEQPNEHPTPAGDLNSEILEIATLRRILGELINTLVRKKLISEAEGANLSNQIFP